MEVKLDRDAYCPVRAHAEDAGLDLFTPQDVTVPAHGSAVIDTGVHVALPRGSVGMLKSKSGLNVKYGITSEGVIDCGYTGSIVAKLYNHGDADVHLTRGMKITQLVILPCWFPALTVVDALEDTERGDGGFGSTGR